MEPGRGNARRQYLSGRRYDRKRNAPVLRILGGDMNFMRAFWAGAAAFVWGGDCRAPMGRIYLSRASGSRICAGLALGWKVCRAGTAKNAGIRRRHPPPPGEMISLASP